MAVRWNIEADGAALRVCKGDHHRSADCEWERYVRETPRPDREQVEALMDKIATAWRSFGYHDDEMQAKLVIEATKARAAMLALIFP